MAFFSKKSNTSKIAKEYIAAPVKYLNGGDDEFVAVVPGKEPYPSLHPYSADILRQCTTFRTIESHAETICRVSNYDRTQYHALVDNLKGLAEEGLLVAKNELPARRASEQESETTVKIDGVVMYTRDRLESAEKGLRSFMENCREHGRCPAFSLFDNSRDPAVRREYGEMLLSLKNEYGLQINYCGFDEKNELAANLVKDGFDEETIRFAFHGIQEEAQNMNPALLYTAGSAFLSTDDDTYCTMAQSPGLSDTIRFTSRDPAEFVLYKDRESLERDISVFKEDVLALHERFLSRGISSHAADGAYDTISPRMRSDILAGRGKIVITSSGVMGDPGMGSTAYYLLRSGDTLRRLMESGPGYREISFSRNVMRCSSSPVITDANLLLGLHHAVDNRSILPPALPCLRNHDGLFITMLFGLVNGSYMAHLPWMIAHRPPLERRSSLEENIASVSTFRAADIMTCVLKNYWASHPVTEIRAGLGAIGSHLSAVGSLDVDDFGGFLRPVLAEELGERIALLENMLNIAPDMPLDMAADIDSYLRGMSKNIRNNSIIVPADLLNGRSEDESVAALKDLIKRFGDLIQAWPEIIGAVNNLKKNGKAGIKMM
ncbi:MAG: hypothetical protein KBA61_13650 [Spirochaetes bacterium]|nr:hypothetical protein [Spirochaetota bacterium]